MQEALERMRAIAAQYPRWRSNLLFGEACFQLARGDYEGAKRYCEECIALAAFDEHGRSKNTVMWLSAHVVLAETLLGLGRDEEARAIATRALDAYAAKNIGSGTGELERVLALAEARLGEVNRALGRLSACIAEQTRLGSTGVQLGMLYEACARIAIMQRDPAAFEQYADLVGREYRSGSGSGLSARFERLLNEATRHGVRRPLNSGLPANRSSNNDWTGTVMRTMAQTQHGERAQAALQIICNARNVDSGQLFLTGPSGLILAAAQGQAPFVPVDEVRAFVERLEAHSRSLDDMETDAELEDPTSTTVLVAGGNYLLLPLACAQNVAQRTVGAVAVMNSQLQVDRIRENQLLTLIAEHLLESTSVIATSQL
jgi:tetratricopeptide (TPR) repeat protein